MNIISDETFEDTQLPPIVVSQYVIRGELRPAVRLAGSEPPESICESWKIMLGARRPQKFKPRVMHNTLHRMVLRPLGGGGISDESVGRPTVLQFAGGKFMVVGCRNNAAARLAVLQHERTMRREGFAVRATNLAVKNIVATLYMSEMPSLHGDPLPFLVALEDMHRGLPTCTTYVPSTIPHLIYRCQTLDQTVLVHRSGKLVLPGAVSLSALRVARREVVAAILPFRDTERLDVRGHSDYMRVISDGQRQRQRLAERAFEMLVAPENPLLAPPSQQEDKDKE